MSIRRRSLIFRSWALAALALAGLGPSACTPLAGSVGEAGPSSTLTADLGPVAPSPDAAPAPADQGHPPADGSTAPDADAGSPPPDPDLGPPPDPDLGPPPDPDLGPPPDPDLGPPPDPDLGPLVPERCDPGSLATFPVAPPRPQLPAVDATAWPAIAAWESTRGTVAGDQQPPAMIAHAEPAPPGYVRLALGRTKDGLVLPDYWDDLPRFERASGWDGTRCYETPVGVQLLTQPQAYDLYRAIAEQTTGVALDTQPGQRSVVGLRGTYPGTFSWHGNAANHFNDTLVLLWREGDGSKQVREFPVNTDTGAHDFGVDSSSSLRPNRRYRYANGWHRGYNALQIEEWGYRVRDDSNHNGHWDSDRNGWWAPAGAADHDRGGSGHNIHMGSVDPPLGSALVENWSAGCQVIPGRANWTAFIGDAWTGLGDTLNYFLVDVRDIPAAVWTPCVPDGSRACPFAVNALPFTDQRDTAQGEHDEWDVYGSCSAADESGAEYVYALTLDEGGTLAVSVDCVEPVDIDVHLLDGDDALACLARNHTDFEFPVYPGRYLIVADTFVGGDGAALAGPYTLHVALH